MLKGLWLLVIATSLVWLQTSEAAETLTIKNSVVQTKAYRPGQLVIDGWGDWFFNHCCEFTSLHFIAFNTEANPRYQWKWNGNLSYRQGTSEQVPLHSTAIIALEGDQMDGEGSSVLFLQEFTVPESQPFDLTMELLLSEFTKADSVAIMCGVTLPVVEALISKKYPLYVPKEVPWGVVHTSLSGEINVL